MEDQYDIDLKYKFGYVFYYKVFFIPSSIILPCFLVIDIYRNYIYIFFSTFTSLLILTWNFPNISKVIYSKPIYFEDLAENQDNENKIQKSKIIYDIKNSSKFKFRFLIFQQFMISSIIALVADYLKSKLHNTNHSTVELFGLIGGILSLMIKSIKIIGSIVLHILYVKKNKNINDDVYESNII